MNGAPDEIELHPAVGECLTRLRAERDAVVADAARWRARAEFAEGEISAALQLPPTLGVAAGELARVLRQTREDLATAMRGVCPRGFVVVTLAQWDDAILSRDSAERGTTAAVAACDFLRATAREYLAAEALVAYELADDSDAGYPAAMLARMHAARTRRDEALARLRALVPP